MDQAIVVKDLAKTFKLYSPVESEIHVFEQLDLTVKAGECVCLVGASGTGKSTLMRSLFGNYLPSGGSVKVLDQGEMVELVGAKPAEILEVRRRTLGYVSQFLRVIPRIPTIDIVMEPLLENGAPEEEARERASVLLSKLRLPENLWSIPPATFSGGEQQRVNIARSFIREYPIMLLDEPTASLDVKNRETVVELIQERLDHGAAMLGIFHDEDVRDAVATRLFRIGEDIETAA